MEAAKTGEIGVIADFSKRGPMTVEGLTLGFALRTGSLVKLCQQGRVFFNIVISPIALVRATQAASYRCDLEIGVTRAGQ